MVYPLRNYSRIGACKGKKERPTAARLVAQNSPASRPSPCPRCSVPQRDCRAQHSNPRTISRGFRNIPRYVLVFQDSSRGGDAA
jgi:hypothetical protein